MAEGSESADLHFPIRFEGWYVPLSTLLLMPPSKSYVLVGPEDIEIRMAWAFHARFPRAAVASATLPRSLTISRGVHGGRGRWLVNGSGRGIVRLDLFPEQRARVLSLWVRLATLRVSVEDPEALVRAIG